MTHTHKFITSKTLRTAYASELWQSRTLRGVFTDAEYRSVKLGLESGIWAVQKLMLMDIMR